MRHQSAALRILTWMCVAWAFATTAAIAQERYPVSTLKIIVPFGASSGPDPVGRRLAERLAEQMGITVVVENREGAGGSLGAQAVANAPADGSVILIVASPPFASAPFLQKRPAYDPVAHFTPIARVLTTPLMLVASKHAPFTNFDEFREYAKRHPGKLNYASSGTGSGSHLFMESLKMAAGNLDVTFVPYKSTGQQMTDVIGGQVQLNVPSVAGAIQQVKAGNVRALAVGSARRSPLMPDVPTFAEASGTPGLEATVWYGIFGPRGMPDAVAQRLSAEIGRAIATPQITALLESMGAEPAFQGSAEFVQTVARGVGDARRLIDALKLPPQD